MLYSGNSVSIRGLSLSSGNLFYEDSGHRIPSRVGVKVWTEARASTNPESHAHLSFVDVVTVAFDMADAMGIYSCTTHVHNTLKWLEGMNIPRR